METLQIEKSNALKAYTEANSKGKALLENLFGKKVFAGNIMERCTTVEGACLELGIDPDTRHDNATDDYERAEIDIKIFARAMREDKDASECFYYPYFYISGGGFSYDGYGHDSANTFVGARLRVDSAEKAKHLGNCMLDFYKTYLGK